MNLNGVRPDVFPKIMRDIIWTHTVNDDLLFGRSRFLNTYVRYKRVSILFTLEQ